MALWERRDGGGLEGMEALVRISCMKKEYILKLFFLKSCYVGAGEMEHSDQKHLRGGKGLCGL